MPDQIPEPFQGAQKKNGSVSGTQTSSGRVRWPLVEDGKALTPQFKKELKLLIADAEAMATAAAPAVASGGANIGVDLGVLEPVVATSIKLAKDFVHLLPALEAALSKIGADIKN